jgi:hypothetical protein
MDKSRVSHVTLRNVLGNAGVHIAGLSYPAFPSLIYLVIMKIHISRILSCEVLSTPPTTLLHFFEYLKIFLLLGFPNSPLEIKVFKTFV